MLLHDSHKPFFREPGGPAHPGQEITFRFRCDEASAVILRTWFGDELAYPMAFDGRDTWQASATLPKEPGLFWYDFIIYRKDGHILRYGAP